MIVFAHLSHWYSAFGFLVPALLVVAWIRYQARRDRRRMYFAEEWTLQLRDGEWRLESVRPATPPRRRGRPRSGQHAEPPWSAGAGESEAISQPVSPAADWSAP